MHVGHQFRDKRIFIGLIDLPLAKVLRRFPVLLLDLLLGESLALLLVQPVHQDGCPHHCVQRAQALLQREDLFSQLSDSVISRLHLLNQRPHNFVLLVLQIRDRSPVLLA